MPELISLEKWFYNNAKLIFLNWKQNKKASLGKNKITKNIIIMPKFKNQNVKFYYTVPYITTNPKIFEIFGL